MASVSIRDLARNASAVVDEVARSGRPALVTKHGKVMVAVVPVSEERLEDFVLANAPEFVASMREADQDFARGRARDAFEVLDEIQGELGAKSRSVPTRRKGPTKPDSSRAAKGPARTAKPRRRG